MELPWVLGLEKITNDSFVEAGYAELPVSSPTRRKEQRRWYRNFRSHIPSFMTITRYQRFFVNIEISPTIVSFPPRRSSWHNFDDWTTIRQWFWYKIVIKRTWITNNRYITIKKGTIQLIKGWSASWKMSLSSERDFLNFQHHVVGSSKIFHICYKKNDVRRTWTNGMHE